MKTKQPSRKDREAKIGLQGDTIVNSYEKIVSGLSLEREKVRSDNASLSRLNIDLRGELGAKDAELAKRVHGLTALTFAILAFAVGIVVGGNIRSRSQTMVQSETNHTEVELLTTNDAAAYALVELCFKPTRLTNLVLNQKYTNCSGGILIVNAQAVFNEVSWTNCYPVPVQKTYRPNPLKKGAELLRP